MTGGLGVGGFLISIFAAPIARQGLGTLRHRRVPPDAAVFSPPKAPAGSHTLPAGVSKINLDAGLTSTSASDHAADTRIGMKAHQPEKRGNSARAGKLVNRRVFFKAAA